MARSKTLSALLDSITPEMEQSWKEERIVRKEMEQSWKEERIVRKNMLTAEYQLGYYVGLRIVDEYLPTLSTDKIQSRRVIGVPKEDAAENGRLNEEWFDIARTGKNGDKEKWDLLFNHNKMLEKKYLPNPLLCHLSPLNIQSMEQFKLGLRLALWDCDMCSYKIESDDIKIYDDEDARFTIIEFSL